MQHPLPQDENSESRSPLISIGLVVLAVLMVPMLLYSGGPDGPAKIGDVVFATERHRVRFVNPESLFTLGYQDFCVLESRTQLVVQQTGVPPDGSLIAEVIGTHQEQPPYCLPRVPVILHPHQVTLHVDLWGGVKNALARVFGGS
ncbi:MAG: hypothetical protein R3B74_17810 [Nitrospirales bacterium]|nr:hypothetical protein [Nitrospirales bacterium]